MTKNIELCHFLSSTKTKEWIVHIIFSVNISRIYMEIRILKEWKSLRYTAENTLDSELEDLIFGPVLPSANHISMSLLIYKTWYWVTAKKASSHKFGLLKQSTCCCNMSQFQFCTWSKHKMFTSKKFGDDYGS